MQNHPDYELILLPLLAGNRDTAQVVFSRCFPSIHTLVGNGGGNRQDAEDVFMNGLEVVYLLAQKPDFILSSSFHTFLYGICRLQWLRILEKKRRHLSGTDASTNGLTEQYDLHKTFDLIERYQLYRDKFDQLGQECKNLLLLSFEGLSYREIAAQMGYSSEKYARKRKFLCKSRLIRLIRQDRRYEELKHDHDE